MESQSSYSTMTNYYSCSFGNGYNQAFFIDRNNVFLCKFTAYLGESTFEIYLNSNYFNFTNLFYLNFSEPSKTLPIKITELVGASNPMIDTPSTLTFTYGSTPQPNSYACSEGFYFRSDNQPYCFALLFFPRARTNQFIGFKSNNDVVMWVKGNITNQNNDLPFYFSNIFDLMDIFPLLKTF